MTQLRQTLSVYDDDICIKKYTGDYIDITYQVTKILIIYYIAFTSDDFKTIEEQLQLLFSYKVSYSKY